MQWLNKLRDQAVTIEQIGGKMPVQAEGLLGKSLRFYFRARHNGWQFHVFKEEKDCFDNDLWFANGSYGLGAEEAGWMPHEDVYRYISQSAEQFAMTEAGSSYNIERLIVKNDELIFNIKAVLRSEHVDDVIRQALQLTINTLETVNEMIEDELVCVLKTEK